MRKFLIGLLIPFFLLQFSELVAQVATETEITIFQTEDSLTIYVPEQGEVSLQGLTLEVVQRVHQEARIITRPIHSFPDFRVLPFSTMITPVCLRLEIYSSDSPVPLDCSMATIYTQVLNDDDAFWYDAALGLDRMVIVKSGGQPVDYCLDYCVITYIPSAFTNPAIIPGCVANIDEREVLVLIAKFEQLSVPQLFPEREWRSILDEAVEALGDDVNVRVLLLRDTVIESDDEAQLYSDLCQATLVIWGEMGRTRIRSRYTVTPRWSQVYTEPGETNVRARSTEDLPELEIFISSFGGDSPYVLQFVLGQLTYFNEDYESALNFFENAIELAPEGREAEMGMAAMYFYRGYIRDEILIDTEGAWADYNRAIDLDPEYASAYNNLGAILHDQGDLEGAMENFNKAIELNSEHADAYSNRGIVLQAWGDLEGAIADYSQAIDLDPEASTYVSRGSAFYDQGKLEAAIVDYDKAIELNPVSVDAYNNRGNARAGLGDLEGAIADYSQAIDLDPKPEEAYNGRGAALFRLGDLEGAMADFERAVELNPQDHKPYNNLGNIHYLLGDLETAIAEYNQAIELSPEYAEAYTNRANAYVGLGRLEEAIADYDYALLLNPQIVEAHHNRGWAYFYLGDNDHAVADWNTAIILQEKQVTALDIESDQQEIEAILENQDSQTNFRFIGTTGKRVSIRTKTNEGEVLDTILILRGPDGAPLAGNDDANAGTLTSAIEQFTLPTDGEYTIVVAGVNGSTGLFKLIFEVVD